VESQAGRRGRRRRWRLNRSQTRSVGGSRCNVGKTVECTEEEAVYIDAMIAAWRSISEYQESESIAVKLTTFISTNYNGESCR
jgi:hypothetical protein